MTPRDALWTLELDWSVLARDLPGCGPMLWSCLWEKVPRLTPLRAEDVAFLRRQTAALCATPTNSPQSALFFFDEAGREIARLEAAAETEEDRLRHLCLLLVDEPIFFAPNDWHINHSHLKQTTPGNSPMPTPLAPRYVSCPPPLAHAVCLLLGLALNAQASLLQLSEPTYDRWIYPFGGGAGTETGAPSFGAPGNPGFDERDSTLYVGYDTASLVTPGLGVSAYQIHSVRLTATLNSGAFSYDPTYDSFSSYLDATNALHTADTDTGRPVELYGAGFRNGQTFASFGESGAYGSPTRSVFAQSVEAGGVFTDVQNNLDSLNGGVGGFNPNFFAIGQAALNPGDAVPAETEFTFDVILNPDTLTYLQQGLNIGNLAFVVSSLHAASFGGPATYPRWRTKENLLGGAVTLEVNYSLHVVPEPSSLALLGAGLFAFRAWRRRP
jgi:hypothetical protein